jgi:fido (protein-threonine AMPylation protein)
MDLFTELYNPTDYHGDEKLLVIASAHHRMAWLHPLRDGNGRVIRLFTGACLNSINTDFHSDNEPHFMSLPMPEIREYGSPTMGFWLVQAV